MYVAVKGGERAIAAAHAAQEAARRGDPAVPALSCDQVGQQLRLAVDRVMGEGGLYDPKLAALAIKQAQGDLIEAAFLLRAYRTTLPRLGYTAPIETGRMRVTRRLSATFKDLPGGQILGPTFDYGHRLLDFALLAEAPFVAAMATTGPAVVAAGPDPTPATGAPSTPRVLDLLGADGLIEPEPAAQLSAEVADLTRQPPLYPVGRDAWLQALARADEGFLLAMGYSTQRGYGGTHPFVGELRVGMVEVELETPDLPFPVPLGSLAVSECETVNQFAGEGETLPRFGRGYGLVLGQAERRAIAMALVDRALRNAAERGHATAPAEDQEFVLGHGDTVQATGFVEHLKLPHYVDFQAELETLRRLRAQAATVPDPATAPARPDEP